MYKGEPEWASEVQTLAERLLNVKMNGSSGDITSLSFKNELRDLASKQGLQLSIKQDDTTKFLRSWYDKGGKERYEAVFGEFITYKQRANAENNPGGGDGVFIGEDTPDLIRQNRKPVLDIAADDFREGIEESNRRGFGQPGRSKTFQIPEEGIDFIDLERNLIGQALNRTGNNQSQAAKLLTVSRGWLRAKALKYGLL